MKYLEDNNWYVITDPHGTGPHLHMEQRPSPPQRDTMTYRNTAAFYGPDWKHGNTITDRLGMRGKTLNGLEPNPPYRYQRANRGTPYGMASGHYPYFDVDEKGDVHYVADSKDSISDFYKDKGRVDELNKYLKESGYKGDALSHDKIMELGFDKKGGQVHNAISRHLRDLLSSQDGT